MQHADDGADDAHRCVEFAALLPFLFGKFRDAVLIGAPEKILALGQILGMDFIRMADRGDHAPAGTFRHVESVLLRISVPIIIIVLPFCDEFLAAFLSPDAKICLIYLPHSLVICHISC